MRGGVPNAISTSTGSNVPNMDIRMSSSGGPSTPMDTRFPGGSFPIPSSPHTPSGPSSNAPGELMHGSSSFLSDNCCV